MCVWPAQRLARVLWCCGVWSDHLKDLIDLRKVADTSRPPHQTRQMVSLNHQLRSGRWASPRWSVATRSLSWKNGKNKATGVLRVNGPLLSPCATSSPYQKSDPSVTLSSISGVVSIAKKTRRTQRQILRVSYRNTAENATKC